MWLSGDLSGVGWIVAGGLEKERLRETGPLFLRYQGSLATSVSSALPQVAVCCRNLDI